MTAARAAPLLRRLGQVVGPHVVDDPGIVASSVTDWTGRFRGRALAVVRPGSVDEVAGVVLACREAGAAIVPQGGNTGLVGGGVPHRGEVVLSTSRLATTDAADADAGQLTAGAGATLAQVQGAAEAGGWAYGVDLASRDSATVGGMVATNAGGLRVLRHGDTRAQVVGVEAVLGTGEVVSHLGGLVKDNTGYHLPGLLCGSEGTLAVVTAVRLRLVPPSPHRTVALLALPGAGAAVGACALLRRALPGLDACELFLAPGLELVRTVAGLPAPFAAGHAAYLLVEASGPRDPTADLAGAVDALSGVEDVAVASDPARRAGLWRYREAHTEAINTLGAPHKLDVTLPADRLAQFVDRVPGTVTATAPGATTWLFGHVGDGNVHVNVTGLAPDDDRVDDAVLSLVAGYGGSISAEHGIGVAKKRWLHLSRSPEEIDAFRAIKHALDPDGVLNPNVLLP